jgi:hypothetical protein
MMAAPQMLTPEVNKKVTEFLAALGLEAKDVMELIVTPHKVTATMRDYNADGKVQVIPGTSTVKTRTLTFK